MIELKVLWDSIPSEYPEVLADLATLIYQRLAALLQVDAASDLAIKLAEDIRLKWGGCLIYIPQGARYERQQRDDAIWRQFNGRNHIELARHYGLTLSCVYDILARARARRQGDLLFRAGE